MLLASCQKQEIKHEKEAEHQPSNGIVGTWQTGLLDGEWGESRISTTYYADGSFDGLVDFTDSGELPFKGAYTIKGDIMERTIEGDTQEIIYCIEGDTLFKKIGDEDYVFKRLTEQDDGKP